MKLSEVKFNLIPRNGKFICISSPPDVSKSKLKFSEKTLLQLAKETEGSYPVYVVSVDPNLKEEMEKMGIKEGGFIFIAKESVPYGTRLTTDKKKFYLDAFIYDMHVIAASVPYTEDYEKFYEDNLTTIENNLADNEGNKTKFDLTI